MAVTVEAVEAGAGGFKFSNTLDPICRPHANPFVLAAEFEGVCVSLSTGALDGAHEFFSTSLPLPFGLGAVGGGVLLCFGVGLPSASLAFG